MAQEIVRLCDPCLAEDERVNATAVTVALNGAPKLLDLCERHEEQLIKPLRDVLASHGQTVAAAPGKRPYKRSAPPSTPASSTTTASSADGLAPELCPLCEWSGKVDSSLRFHLEKAHPELGLSSLLRLTKSTCALCGTVHKGAGASSLTAHVRGEHGEPSISRSLHSAGLAGDPHHVLAQLMHRASATVQ